MRGQRGRCQVRAKMELCPNEKADHEEQSEDGDAVFSAVHAVLKRSLGPKKWRVKEERCECSTYTTCLLAHPQIRKGTPSTFFVNALPRGLRSWLRPKSSIAAYKPQAGRPSLRPCSGKQRETKHEICTFGRTGLIVSHLAFGAMTFTSGNKNLASIYKVKSQFG
jgi:hypothetical protein